MRVLLLHNYYGSAAPSGENQAFETEREMLLKRGHEVEVLTRHSDEIRAKGVTGVIQGALATPWNPWMARAVRAKVEAFGPDVVHVHNTFPLLSPAIFHAIGHRAARVLTLHNYRLFCLAGITLRESRICTECLDRHSALPALKHGCYRGSRLATLPLAMSVELHRRIGTWTRQVDAFIALTEFQREQMVKAGLPTDRVHVKPHFYPGHPKPESWRDREDCAVFAGRLVLEKGVETLVRAWLLWGEGAPELRVLGDGPLRKSLERLAATAPTIQVRILGQLSSEDAERHIAHAKLLILPSVFEGFPMVIRDAFAFGTPAAVSDIEPLPLIVQHGVSGVVFSPGDAQSLLREVRAVWEEPGLLQRLGEGARAAFERHYTEEANYRILMAIYSNAVEMKKRQVNGR